MRAPKCPRHGAMSPRPIERQNAETRWCGAWFDCADPHCGRSVLLPSPELAASLREQRGERS